MQAPDPTTPGAAGPRRNDADVLVVGAGPAGSTAAAYLARAGLDVLVLEKSTFPRAKVCGDGLTPRAVKQLVDLGVDCSEAAGWRHNKGLRVVAGGASLELPWPTTGDYPDYGAVRTRQDFDDLLLRHARKQGARVQEATTVTAAVTENGSVVGVEGREGPDKRPVAYRAPLTLACDGVSARVALSLGMAKDDRRPLGVAVRRYHTSPRSEDDFLETHLEIWDRRSARPTMLPGYGWVFGMGDGTVNVGLGVLAGDRSAGSGDHRGLLEAWTAEIGLGPETAVGPIGGAGLPMGFNRTPHARPGLLLVGDAGGMVNPFNGEGIAYAMESAAVASRVAVQALARSGASAEAALAGYPAAMSDALGSYYRIGNLFSKLIGNPTIMAMATKYGLPRETLMRFILKLLANLYDPRDGSVSDRVIVAMTKLAPSL